MVNRKMFITKMGIFLVILVLSSASAIEITDPTNDIWHQEKNTESNQWDWKSNNLTDRPYIDVINVKYDSEDEFEVIINFLDSMDETKIIGCEMFYGNYTPYRYYRFHYTTETNTVQMTSFGFSFFVNKTIDFDFTNNRTQIRFNTSLPSNDEGFTLWGFSYEYSSNYEKNWADFFPSSFEPKNVEFDDSSQDDQNQNDDKNNSDDSQDQNGNDDNGQDSDNSKSDDTPGFEFLFFSVSIILFIIVASKKNK